MIFIEGKGDLTMRMYCVKRSIQLPSALILKRTLFFFFSFLVALCIQIYVLDLSKNHAVIPSWFLGEKNCSKCLPPFNSWRTEYFAFQKQSLGRVWILCFFSLGYNLYFYWTTVSRPCGIANNTLKIEWKQLPQQRLMQKVKLHLCHALLLLRPALGWWLCISLRALTEQCHLCPRRMTPLRSASSSGVLQNSPQSRCNSPESFLVMISQQDAANRWGIILANNISALL